VFVISFHVPVSIPPNRSSEFPRFIAISEGDFEQDAKVPALPKAIKTSMKNFPVPYEVMDSREAAPLGQPGTNDLTLTCVLLTS
jgi:hypothetical protein